MGATASNEAASLIAGVIAGSLQKTLAKHLPLDVLTIDTGGGQGLTGTQLEAGRYVTDRLYVGYVGRIGADPALYQNRNAVHVEYRLTARWQIAGEYGDVGTGSADLMWKKLLSARLSPAAAPSRRGLLRARMRGLAGAPLGAGVRARGRQLDGEGAPHARDRTDAHPPAVRVGDPLDRGQPEADARLAAVWTAHVRLERLLAELGRQAGAVVFDLDPDAPRPADPRSPARGRRCGAKGRRPHI